MFSQHVEAALVQLCKVQAVLVHTMQVLVGQLCNSAGRFGRFLGCCTPSAGHASSTAQEEEEEEVEEGGRGGGVDDHDHDDLAELVDATERQALLLETLLTSYSAPKNIEEHSKSLSLFYPFPFPLSSSPPLFLACQ